MIYRIDSARFPGHHAIMEAYPLLKRYGAREVRTSEGRHTEVEVNNLCGLDRELAGSIEERSCPSWWYRGLILEDKRILIYDFNLS